MSAPSAPPGSPQAGVDRDVLTVLSGLVSELRGADHAKRVTLDQSLERELGISSLERVELIARLERRFGVECPEDVAASADTARALARMVTDAAATAGAAARPSARVVLPTRPAVPPPLPTLVDVLEWHAAEHPDRVHLVLRDEHGDETPLTYGQLAHRAHRVAAGLRAAGVARGETVAIMLRTEMAFFSTFLGSLLLGAVPVPLYPPFRADRIEEYAVRQVGILDNAQSRVLVTFGAVERVAHLLRAQVSSLSSIVTPTELGDAADDRSTPSPASVRAPGLSGADGALIQYTSGSTGAPKGVYLTHANLIANIGAIADAIGIEDGDVAVSWLPLYHDMGLIGAWLSTFYHGLPLVVMSPLTFLTRPVRWLEALSEHRGTISAGPNFAYDLCTRRVADEELDGLDLSSVRALLNGAEAVLPDTLRRFTNRFAAHGLRPEALCPVYGLAECSVALAIPPVTRGPRIDVIDPVRFRSSGEAVPLTSDGSAEGLSVVGCGRAVAGHEMRAVDDEGRALPERTEGSIEFRGPSVSSGYYRQPEATAAIKTDDGWTRTGDLGYLADGEIFITGRRKDLIIKGGRNFYPPEIEELVASVDGIRQGCVAAFGVRDDVSGTERLVVVAETRETDEARRDTMRAAVLDRLVGGLGIPADEVVLAHPGAVLKTSSGKIRRSATRDAYLQGHLARGPRSFASQWVNLLTGAIVGLLRRGALALASWAYTAAIALWLGVSLPPLLGYLWLATDAAAARRGLHAWARWTLRVCGVRLDVDGREHLARSTPAIYVANHASYLDAAAILALLPPSVTFVVKARLVAYPVLGLVIRRCDFVLAERGAHEARLTSASAVVERLTRGESIFVFPEGTFVRAPGLLPFKLGAFQAAVDAGRPVVPMALRGTRTMLPDGSWAVRPTRLSVVISAPVAASGHGWADTLRLRDEARAVIARGIGEVPASGDPETALFSEFA
ncbi:MAG: AMP-binding protein [Vicinamibacterales bacterium]